jgi:hypothetical protein
MQTIYSYSILSKSRRWKLIFTINSGFKRMGMHLLEISQLIAHALGFNTMQTSRFLSIQRKAMTKILLNTLADYEAAFTLWRMGYSYPVQRGYTGRMG